MADYVDIRYVLYCIDEHKKVTYGCSKMTIEISDLIHDQLIDIMKHAPVVDAMPVRHGRLIKPHPFGNCSVCGFLIDIHDNFKYCPNCGARMDGVG